jgi:hypothetical protein
MDIFLIYLAGTFFINLSISAICLETGDLIGLQWVNPILIYNNVSVNWFGCIVLTILAHIAAGPWVVFYWLYKLCTVGRK